MELHHSKTMRLYQHQQQKREMFFGIPLQDVDKNPITSLENYYEHLEWNIYLDYYYEHFYYYEHLDLEYL